MKRLWSGVADSWRLPRRPGRWVAVGLGLVLLLGLWLTAAGAPSTPSSATASPGAGTAAASPAASPSATGEAVVHIKDFFFDPAKVTIKVGTTVKWINDGPTAHTILGQQGPKTLFGSQILAKGQSYSFTFKKAGTYPYICGLHPNMKGVVVVEP